MLTRSVSFFVNASKAPTYTNQLRMSLVLIFKCRVSFCFGYRSPHSIQPRSVCIEQGVGPEPYCRQKLIKRCRQHPLVTGVPLLSLMTVLSFGSE
jgi:hypothetical protein